MTDSLKKFLSNQEEAVEAAKAIVQEELSDAVSPVKEAAINMAFNAARNRSEANMCSFPSTEELLRHCRAFEKYIREKDTE